MSKADTSALPIREVDLKSSYVVSRRIFLRLMAWIHFCAFASVYCQFHGLLSSHGLTPVSTVLERSHREFPFTLFWDYNAGLDEDTFTEAACLAGMVLSLLACCGLCVAPVFWVLWSLHLFVFRVGGTFLGFQWDILLIETGFLTALVAPLTPSSVDVSGALVWVIRFVLFKLMLLSGAVKVQSMCPTWLGLTALNYHYASQCIPTPLAWYAHQLPELVQKISVAATFLIEIPLAVLLIAPLRSWRIVGAVSQVLLMVVIALTGNYTYFNMLTAALCVLCFDDAVWATVCLKARLTTAASPPPAAASSLRARLELQGPLGVVYSTLARYGWVGLLLVAAFVCERCFAMFRVTNASGWWDVKLIQSWAQMQGEITLVLPYVCAAMAATIVVVGLSHALAHLGAVFSSPGKGQQRHAPTLAGRAVSLFRCCRALLLGGVALWLFSASLIPLTEIAPDVRHHFPPQVFDAYRAAAPLTICNGYGLFRHMTGVGPTVTDSDGRPRTTVQRPEVVVEGSADGRTWEVIEFLYKPTSLSRTPPWVAPHQPRLDWQMWFAALGSYQHNPWFIHLLDKILDGSETVNALLAPHAFTHTPPLYVRANLYHYDFTTFADNTTNWWKRELVGEYVPMLDRDNPSVKQYLQSAGLAVEPPPVPSNTVALFLATARPHRLFVVYTHVGVLVLVLGMQVWRRKREAVAVAPKKKKQ